MGDTFDVRIERLAYGGDGVGRLPDGRAVFVPFAIPGERVRIQLVEEKTRYTRAAVPEVLEASPQRVTPRCQHFGYCGGCHYQHIDYPSQVEAKAAILQEQLARIGGVAEIPLIETLPASQLWNYRNNIQFHLTREGKLGFQKTRSNQTFAIQECHLPEASINHAWPLIDAEPVSGLERISIRVGMDEDLMLILESSSLEPLEFDIEGLPISIIHTNPQGSLVLAGSDHVYHQVLGRQFIVSSGSFFQTNTYQAEVMVRQILENLSVSQSMTVLDVYCGVGLFSAFLAPRVKSVVGIELSPDACADYTANLDEYDNVSLYEAPAENVLNSINFQPDVIIVDPPREGLGGRTVDGLLAQEARHLVYVSCDPATLARDAKRLVEGGYILQKLIAIDIFPQTYHIESMSFWNKT